MTYIAITHCALDRADMSRHHTLIEFLEISTLFACQFPLFWNGIRLSYWLVRVTAQMTVLILRPRSNPFWWWITMEEC